MARNGHFLWIAQALTLALFILPVPLEHVAHACGNAVFVTLDKRAATVAEAQAALDEGDVLHARELAMKVNEGQYPVDTTDRAPEMRLAARAGRIAALSFARDADAASSELVWALAVLGKSPSPSDPTLQADRGELLARIPDRHDEAFGLLEPLAEKDLIGSPHALGALFRIAKERGDVRTANLAKARCEGMIGTGAICRGGYGHAPLIRGTTMSYLPAAILALAALAFRLLRARRVSRGGTDETGRSLAAPWIGHAAPLQALAIVGAGLYVFVHPSSPVWTTSVLGIALLLCLGVERRGFFAAVRRGKMPGLVLRPAGPDDAHLPVLALFRGPIATETLEQDRSTVELSSQPGYRDAARKPLLRVGRRPLPLGLSFAAATAIAFVFLLGLFALFGMLVTLRSS